MFASRVRWDIDADVVVIGYGCAGSVAAITAQSAGAKVLVLEKQPQDTLVTSSLMSGALFICPNDAKEAKRHLEALYQVEADVSWTDSETLGTWAKRSMENVKWIESLGMKVEFFMHGGGHRLPGVEAIDVHMVLGEGPGMMRGLYDQVTSRGIPVMYNMRANTLLMNTKGEVTGVRAKQLAEGGKEVNIQARRGVILASGGFEHNSQLKLNYLKVYPTHFDAAPALTGDAIPMALGVGAELWHMNCCAGGFSMKFPELGFGLAPALGSQYWRAAGNVIVPQGSYSNWFEKHHAHVPIVGGYVITDRSGKRFTSENYDSHTVFYELTLFDTKKLMYPRVPSYWIFDQKRFNDGYLPRRNVGGAGPAGLYKWSKDNSEELARGWIVRGETIKDLAAKIGLDAANLNETVNNYNQYCKNKVDPEFNRPPETLVPLNNPPYYAVKLWPGGPNTQGGPRRNGQAEVLRADGTPVPRLYSAGELGSIFGMMYPTSGGNIGECIAFGRIAAENASELPPL